MKIENFNPCAIIRVKDLRRYERAARRQLQVAQRQLVQKYGLPSSGQVHAMEIRLCLEGASYETQEKLRNLDQILSERMGQKKRLSKEPSINHSRRIVNQMIKDGIQDKVLLLAGLGHDSVEDKFMTLDEIEQLCGKEVRELIDGVTKLGEEIGKEKREKESLIKLTEAACTDPRVVILKAYDNLDNWRDQRVFLKDPKRKEKPGEHSEETLKVYTPFLNAFNFWLMRVRLEDAAQEFSDPDYENNLVIYDQAVARCREKVEAVAKEIEGILSENGIRATVTYQTKRYSEIYRTCNDKKRKISMAALFNNAPLFAHYISVVTETASTAVCRWASGVVEEVGTRRKLFKPLENRKSNLEVPRENDYRAEHAYVDLPGEGTIMIGYTTRDLDLENRYGKMLAEGMRMGFAPGWAMADPRWLRRLRDLMRSEGLLTVKEIRDRIPKIASPIKVYTPKREEFEMQEDATALDFALATGHLNVGCIYVNGIKVEPGTELRSNDVIRVEDSPDSIPHPSWLLSVHTHEASAKIREFLRQLPPDKRRKIGVEALNNLFDKKYLKWQEDKAASEIKPISGIKTTSEIKSTSEVREMLEYFSGIYRDQIASLLQKGILGGEDLQGNNLKTEGMEILVGIGQIDIQEVENVFYGIFKASLDRRKKQKEKSAFAILFNVAQNRAGLQEEIERDIKAAGFDIKKDAATVNSDESATFGYVFEIYSTIEQRQIENIVIRNKGNILTQPLRLRMKAQEFQLTEWLAKHGVVI